MNNSKNKQVRTNKQSKKAKKPKSVTTLPGVNRVIDSASVTAVNTQMISPTFTKVMIARPHPELGEGIRVHGNQLLCTVATAASGNDLLVDGTATTAVNSIQINPDSLNGRIALIGRTYDRYVFRKIVLRYCPRVATTQAGSFSLGVVNDGYLTGFASVSFAAILQMTPSMLCPFREKGVLTVEYKGDNVWYSEIDAATAAGSRQTYQLSLFAYPDAGSIGAVTQGQIFIEYLVDFYQPSLDYGFSVAAKTKAESELLKRTLQSYRDAQKATPKVRPPAPQSPYFVD